MRKEKIVSNYEMKMPEEQLGNSSESKSLSGIIISLLIVILILILGGLYIWSEILKREHHNNSLPENSRPTPEENNEPESATAEATVETLQALSTSDELSAIEADLTSTRIEPLEGDFSAIIDTMER